MHGNHWYSVTNDRFVLTHPPPSSKVPLSCRPKERSEWVERSPSTEVISMQCFFQNLYHYRAYPFTAKRNVSMRSRCSLSPQRGRRHDSAFWGKSAAHKIKTRPGSLAAPRWIVPCHAKIVCFQNRFYEATLAATDIRLVSRLCETKCPDRVIMSVAPHKRRGSSARSVGLRKANKYNTSRHLIPQKNWIQPKGNSNDINSGCIMNLGGAWVI